MKRRICLVCILLGIALTGCGSKESKENDVVLVESMSVESSVAEADAEDGTVQENVLDDTLYIGEYLDENKDPNLEIAKGQNGEYIVQIGIFRLASMGDGVGEQTEEGMHFTATDMAGNPISGIITIKGEIATVTFTDSTWELIENGTSYEYTKSSDEPRIWE